MSKAKRKTINRVKKIVKEYINYLETHDFPVEQAYIFGSFARGDFRKDSDIDVAIISKKLVRNWDRNELLLWKMRREIDARIEPIGYKPSEFNLDDPLVDQIKKVGIRIK